MAFATPIPELIQRNGNGLLGKHPSWERVRLGDVATVQNGAAFKSEYFNTDGRGMPLLRIRDIVPGATETWYDGPYEEEYVVNPGDLVIGMDGEFNHALWAGPPALLNQRVCRLLFHTDGLKKDWVLRVLGGYLEAVNEATPSVTVKHLSSKTVADLLLPLPPLQEQAELVEKLRTLDSEASVGELRLRAAVGQLPRYRESTLVAGLTGLLGGNSCEDANSLLDEILAARRERWAATGMGRYSEPVQPAPRPDFTLPAGWTWATVDQLAVGVQYGTSAKTNGESSDGVPVLRMGNIVEGRLELTHLKYLPRDHAEFPALLLSDGDILFNRTNSPELVGKTAVVRGLQSECSFASYLIRVRLAPEIEPEWVAFWLNSPFGRSWVRENVSQQVGQANVNGAKLRALTLPLPPRAVQVAGRVEMERLLAAGVDLWGRLSLTLRDSLLLRRGICAAAVVGELVGQRPTDEPAEQLLRRIAREKAEREAEARAAKRRNNSRAVLVAE
jgi:type I restriction enzyme S subunit